MDLKLEIKNAKSVLEDGGVIVYPTDTIWGIGCDATDHVAVQKVFALKQRAESKSLIILVSDKEMLKKYVPMVPEEVTEFLARQSRPTTVIYNNPLGLALNVVSSDHTVAIRIPDNAFCQGLIRDFGKPIVSTSANYSNSPSPGSFDEIDKSLLKRADYIVNLSRREKQGQASQIVKVREDGSLDWIRK